MSATLYCGDALAVLRTLPDGAARCCVTSPPYWGLRDYGVPGQLGLERTPEEYVVGLVSVFREVRRVLAADGTLWLNLGDSYATGAGRVGDAPGGGDQGARWKGEVTRHRDARRRDHGRPFVNGRGESQDVPTKNTVGPMSQPNRMPIAGLKPKDLVGIPWRVAFALQADGWWLRSDIIWSKSNPMPESVTDRPTKAHEYVFLLSRAERYFYEADAIADEAETAGDNRAERADNTQAAREFKQDQVGSRTYTGFNARYFGTRTRTGKPTGLTRNARTVWEIATQAYPQAHFATFPEELARRCILAGSAPGDTVLDPFGGSGTVAQVATGNGRDAIYIDLNPKYLALAEQRIGPMLCERVA